MEGIWEGMNRALRRTLTEQLGRGPEPSAAIVDSQSVKITGVGGEQRGFDGGAQPAHEQRPREALLDRRGFRPRGHGAAHGHRRLARA